MNECFFHLKVICYLRYTSYAQVESHKSYVQVENYKSYLQVKSNESYILVIEKL